LKGSLSALNKESKSSEENFFFTSVNFNLELHPLYSHQKKSPTRVLEQIRKSLFGKSGFWIKPIQ